MNADINPICLAAIVSALALPVQAAVIYSDDFSTASDSAGSGGRVGFTTAWTPTLGTADVGVMEISSNGSQTVFSRTESDSGPEDAEDFVMITHGFSTEGYTNITVSLTAFQSVTDFEANFDLLAIQYSFDGSTDWTNLLIDRGSLNDPLTHESSSGSGAGQGSQTTPSSSGFLALPAGAADNADFAIRLLARYNAVDERYFIDEFQLTGDVIPEPTTGLLALVGTGLLLIRRRA